MEVAAKLRQRLKTAVPTPTGVPIVCAKSKRLFQLIDCWCYLDARHRRSASGRSLTVVIIRAGPGEVHWEDMTTVVSTELLKFAIASPATSTADLQGQANGCEVILLVTCAGQRLWV